VITRDEYARSQRPESTLERLSFFVHLFDEVEEYNHVTYNERRSKLATGEKSHEAKWRVHAARAIKAPIVP